MTRFVVVDATPLGPEPSGARRRLEALLPRIAALLPDDVFEVHWARDGGGPPDGLLADNVVHATVDVSWRGGGWRWWRRARALQRRHRDAPFSHLLVDHGPVVVREGLHTVVTLHDLRFLHGYGGWWRRLYGRVGYGRALRRASAVVAVAPAVAEEACLRYGLDRGRVHVAPNAAGERFRPSAEATRAREVLVVGRDEPRKAVGAALAAARAAGWSVRRADGTASAEELLQAYRRARWLLAPSLEEGYDLPVAEALSCGTPVIASAIPAHADLLGLGAEGLVLVDPPERVGGGWRWPGAVRRLAEAPPSSVAPPRGSWDDAARVLAATIADA